MATGGAGEVRTNTHYVNGREVAEDMVQELRALLSSTDSAWVTSKQDTGLTVQYLARAGAVIVRSVSTLDASPRVVWEKVFSNPRHIVEADVFVKSIEPIEEFDMLHSVILMTIVTPAGACKAPLFHVLRHDPFQRAWAQVDRGIELDDAWRQKYAEKLGGTPDASPTAAPAIISSEQAWHEHRPRVSTGTFGIGLCGTLFSEDQSNPDRCICSSVLTFEGADVQDIVRDFEKRTNTLFPRSYTF